MSFWGESFSFNGKSCEEFGLMLYDFNNTSQGNSKFAPMALQEERIPGRYRTLFYDAWHNKPLEFTLIFGEDEYAANEREPIDRHEMQVIASWLTDQHEYGWLTIDEPEMEGIGYRCIITDLEMLEAFGDKWAFKATVHCDSPYAYMLPRQYRYTVRDTEEIKIKNRSSINDPYQPVIKIAVDAGNSFSIVNKSDNNRVFTLENLPQGCGEITIDGERGLLYCESGVNIYDCCKNFQWPRLVSGDNYLTLIGNGRILFTCQYPVNVGG